MRLAPLATINPIKILVYLGVWFFLLVLLQLSGCASMVSEQQAVESGFRVQGKLIVSSAQDKSAVNFSWQQTQGDYVIEVWGALGQGRVQLRGNPQRMRVVRGDDVIFAGKLEQVMQRQLGWSIPITAIPYWLLGQPQPKLRYADYSLEAQGHVVSFIQAG